MSDPIIALVTGASPGIGRGISRQLSARDGRVAPLPAILSPVHGRRRNRGTRWYPEIEGRDLR